MVAAAAAAVADDDGSERPKAQAAPTEENAVANEDQLVVTLGPPRDGIQRALMDEVAGNIVETNFNIDEKGRLRPEDMDAYDDNFVEIPEEQPIFIPRPYRNETTQKPPVTQPGFIGGNIHPVQRVTQPPQTQPVQPTSSKQPLQQVKSQTAPQAQPNRAIQPQGRLPLRPQAKPQQPQPQPAPIQTQPQKPQFRPQPQQQPQPQPQPAPTNFVQQPQPQPQPQQPPQKMQLDNTTTIANTNHTKNKKQSKSLSVGAQQQQQQQGGGGGHLKKQQQQQKHVEQHLKNETKESTSKSGGHRKPKPKSKPPTTGVEESLMLLLRVENQRKMLAELRRQQTALKEQQLRLEMQKQRLDAERFKQIQQLKQLELEHELLLKQQHKLLVQRQQLLVEQQQKHGHRTAPEPPFAPPRHLIKEIISDQQQQQSHQLSRQQEQQEQQEQAQAFATDPPTLPPVPQLPVPQPVRPVRPRPQPPHSPPRVLLQPQQRPGSVVNAPNLRTGVCHASIFYISSPLQTQSRLTFTHFAVAVSVDQCARTCHEFNCAIAHYDPSTGHCQFNPSTAFAVREGQCPKWPSAHFRNNVVTQGPIRIFCVQCHRPFRRGRGRSRVGRFHTRVVQPQFTGRIPSPGFRNTALARSAKRSFEPVTLEDDSFVSIIDGTVQRQPQAASVNANHMRGKAKPARSGNRFEIDGTEIERKIAAMPRSTRPTHQQQQALLSSSTITREEPSEMATANADDGSESL